MAVSLWATFLAHPVYSYIIIGAVVAEVNESALARHPILSVVDYGIEALNSLPASMWVNKHKRQQALRFVTLYILTRSKA